MNNDFLNSFLKFDPEWSVFDIVINPNLREIDIFIEYKLTTGVCPSTNREYNIYDYSSYQRFRNQNIFDYKTYINVKLPRIKNKNKKIFTIGLNSTSNILILPHNIDIEIFESLLLNLKHTNTESIFY